MACGAGVHGEACLQAVLPPVAAPVPADASPDKPSCVRGSLAIRVGSLCQLQHPSVELAVHSRVVSGLRPHVLLQPVSPKQPLVN